MKSLFVFNPESGNGRLKKHKEYILSRLREAYGDVECIETTHPLHASELASKAVGNYDYFFVGGGDGTISEVINGMGEAENKPIIGYIPCGTVNDLAKSLGLSKNIKKAVDTLVSGMPLAHDIFKTNDRYGIYVCCCGLFTKASYRTARSEKKHFGKLAYFVEGFKDVFKAKPVHTVVSNPSETIEKDCAMVLIMNSRSVAGIKLNKSARIDDGKVDVVLFHSSSKKVRIRDMLKCVKAFVFGLDSVKNDKNVTYRSLDQFHLSTPTSEVVNVDGEQTDNHEVDFSVIKEAVKILVPQKKCKKTAETDPELEPEA